MSGSPKKKKKTKREGKQALSSQDETNLELAVVTTLSLYIGGYGQDRRGTGVRRDALTTNIYPLMGGLNNSILLYLAFRVKTCIEITFVMLKCCYPSCALIVT